MLAERRLNSILAKVNRQGSVSVGELTEALEVSEATIRRDLAYLADRGLVNKVHGGATARTDQFGAGEKAVAEKRILWAAEKEAIGQWAAGLVESSDFVFIDAGTTTMRLVEALGPTKASFVTSGVAHASLLIKKGLRAYILGGLLKGGTEAVVGVAALAALERYNFTKAFLGANGVSLKEGLTTPDMEEAAIKGQVVEKAQAAYALVDHSKFGLVSAVSFAPLAKVTLVTDRRPEDAYSLAAKSLSIVMEADN
ncbi:MAG: DeoR/GlpR family DNA-binding transcription regulator [Deltaproteobacteria bacterium]|jgi:DeoR family fructose operon transcriptional repressor|nr:DeoR/GlpR family DNA-binding transcription regulator [Deltaproteobacteria bacterium]